MSATTIHFVRHGKVYNPDHLLYERLPDFHLSDLGRRMAQATATYLAKNPQTNTIAAVYSSPLDRTRETAGAILDALNPVREARGEAPLTLTTDERVIEAGNWKLVTNLYKPSWGESYQHIAARMDDFAREKVAQHPGEQIVVVSHESPIFSYRHYLETGHPEHWMFLRHTALASVTSVTYDNETGRVMSITYVDPAANVK